MRNMKESTIPGKVGLIVGKIYQFTESFGKKEIKCR